MKNTPLYTFIKIISKDKNINVEQDFFVKDNFEYNEFASFRNHD